MHDQRYYPMFALSLALMVALLGLSPQQATAGAATDLESLPYLDMKMVPAEIVITVTGGEPIVTDESGTTGTFTVVLTTMPTGDVIVTFLSDDTSEGLLPSVFFPARAGTVRAS